MVLKCKECGGTLDVDDSKSIMCCPYCGSKEFIEESDSVKIVKNITNTIKDIQKTKYEHEDANKPDKEEQRKREKQTLVMLIIMFIVGFGMLILSNYL